jgi:hypothetical protein
LLRKDGIDDAAPDAEPKRFRRSGRRLGWGPGLVLLSASLVAGLTALIAAGCGGRIEKNGPGRAEATPAVAADSLRVSLALDSGSYAVDEAIKMTLVVTNATGQAVKLTFPTAQRFDFVVRKGGKPVWQWSSDMMFAQINGSETMAPGGSLEFTAEWNQRLADGTNPGLGAYTLQGILKSLPEIATPERPFGIVD